MNPRKFMVGMGLAAVGLVALGLIVSGPRVAARGGLVPDPTFAQDSAWDDGKAELATYEVVRPFYGKLCKGQATFIIVKEPWDTERNVKADDSRRVSAEVLKLHRIEEIQTPYYPYRFATSVFVERQPGLTPLKLTTTSQEWCGTTFQSWQRQKDKTAWYEWRSYFGSEGSGRAEDPAPSGSLLLVDALPVQLRGLDLRPGHLGQATLAGTTISSHARTAEPVRVEITATEEEKAWRLELTQLEGDLVATIWLAPDRPRVMEKARFADGTEYTLESVERRAYWPGGDR